MIMIDIFADDFRMQKSEEDEQCSGRLTHLVSRIVTKLTASILFGFLIFHHEQHRSLFI